MGICNEKLSENLHINHFQSILSLIKYEDIPLVSIEQAIQPLVSFLPKIDLYFQLIKDKSLHHSDQLTFDQSASIMLCTILWQPYHQCLYFNLNSILQTTFDINQYQPWLLYLKLLFSSLRHLPSNHLLVYRGSQLDLSKQYHLHQIFSWFDLSLCTNSMDYLQTYEHLKTIFLIECQTIKNIGEYCYGNQKNLFVFLPGTKFQVMDCIYQENEKFYLIKLKEIQSSCLLHSIEENNFEKEKSLNIFQRFCLLFKSSQTDICNRYRNPSLEHQINNTEHSWTIDLDRQNLTDRDMKIVVKYAIMKKNCTRIRLRENLITARGSSILSEGLYNNHTLESLDLRNNQISDIGVQFLSLAIVYSNLKTLNLESNEITAEGAIYLAQMLKDSRTLAELYLSNNHLGDRGVQLLANVLKDKTIDSQEGLGQNNQSTLQHLYLGQNEITDEGFKYLSDMLKTNRTLTWLWLTENEISNNGIEYLTNILAEYNYTLEWLFLNSNKLITDSSVDNFIHILKRNHTLKTLYLNNCNLSEITKRKLLQITKTKKDFDLEV